MTNSSREATPSQEKSRPFINAEDLARALAKQPFSCGNTEASVAENLPLGKKLFNAETIHQSAKLAAIPQPKTCTVISCVRSATDTKTRDIRIDEILTAIRTGGEKLKGQITQIRNRFAAELAITGGNRKAAKRAVEQLKKSLSAVMWCGQFSNREHPAADRLQQHSGLLIADLDGLGDKLPEIRTKLRTSPHVFAFFLSPTGDGLKVVICVPADVSKHAGSFRAMQKHVLEQTGIRVDESGKDPARLCFLSYDPDLYVNVNAREIEPSPEPEKPKLSRDSAEWDGKPDKAQIREMLQVIPKRPEYHDWIGVVAAVGDALPDGDAVEVLHEWSPEEQAGEYLAKLHSGFKHIHVGTLIHIAKQHGWEPPKAGTQHSADERETDLTSLSSFSSYEADYPAPPHEAAFYGLAGDIVRRIEPHTEADKVALLIHLLAGYGNASGRKPHAIADGSRHGLNLNFVAVGESGKGRKGTAYSHMRRIYRRAAEDWTNDCLTSGLSSGEGLIYEVRDPVVKRVKQKDGSYSPETVDDGVPDKRRMFVESELSLLLRVMSREGNTLSAVIRAAWDGSTLKTAVKNSPNKATGAHIAIGGHVTRDEVRQELTATDQANGFANRFLWIAVRRSKCLPEGGHLEDENLNDLVTRLHQAIEFARHTGEIIRDEQARELWRAVYPELSEGKPGLLGAITARAEAQVLRLSCHYALLDLSAVVRIEHLKAALALWDYCERSAQWIFKTGTGNKNADRILAALTVAKNTGLTKRQIIIEVFNRNATKFEIDEGLRLLHRLKLANYVIEETGGRPAERWFLSPKTNEQNEQRRVGEKGSGSFSSASETPPPEKLGRTPDCADAAALNTRTITPLVERNAEAVSDELAAMPQGLLPFMTDTPISVLQKAADLPD